MNFWRNVSPRGALSDLVHEWRQPNRHRWPVLGVSIAATFALMMVFLPESQRAEPPKPEVTWIATFDSSRTDAQIAASNLANQKRQDELRALREQRAEVRKELYRELGRATFLDVDAMEAEIKRDEAAKAAEAAAKARAVQAGVEPQQR